MFGRGNKTEANVKDVVWKCETGLTGYVSVRFKMSQDISNDKLVIRIACQIEAKFSLEQNRMQKGILYLPCH